jgi:RHS repeat-associated protein
MDDRQRVAMIDRHTIAAGPPDPTLVRYQGADHLGSSRLETDADARVISYEEYHPFGTTAYQAVDKDVIAAARRYRYTEMERDEESGLEHHGARYYVPWLGRWTAPDKLADQLTGNRYAYVKNNPVIHFDSNGMSEEPVHGATSFRLLVAAGFTPADAARIALADAAMDHDPEDTAGAGDTVDHPERVRHGHFDPEHAVSRIEADIAGFGGRGATHPEPGKLETLGRDYHNLEDVGFPDAPGPHTRGSKALAPDLIAAGVWLGALGGVLMGVSSASGVSKDAQTGLIVAAAVLFLISLALLSIGSSLIGLGHGDYTSETGERSAWYPSGKYVNDQAYQDPVGNAALLRREFEGMQRAAVAYYGGPRPVDREAAERAIYQVTHADTSEKISAVINAPVDAAGTSYASILSTRGSRPGRRPWTVQQLDVGPFSAATQRRSGVPGKTFVYDPKATWRWATP